MSTRQRLSEKHPRQYWEGQSAYCNGESIDANPYSLNHNPNLYYAWRTGWLDAQLHRRAA